MASTARQIPTYLIWHGSDQMVHSDIVGLQALSATEYLNNLVNDATGAEEA